LAAELVRELLNSGIHFGHRVSRWNPKMKPYIFGKRNMIHVIDIKETMKGLLRAKQFLTRLVAKGGEVLFVGTKRQAKNAVELHAKRCQMHYVTERWLGGTLTNFQTVRARLARLEELERLEETGELANYSKKRIASLQREAKKIKRNLEGLRRMNAVPAVMVVFDVGHEHIAVREAKKLGIPTVCLIDTNADLDYADLPIPGNDDSMRAAEIISRELADAVLEGIAARPEEAPPAGTVGEESQMPERLARARPRRRPPMRGRPARPAEGVPDGPGSPSGPPAPAPEESVPESAPEPDQAGTVQADPEAAQQVVQEPTIEDQAAPAEETEKDS